uniref:Phosphatidylinositol-3,4,5-trisphosphate 3-phosphatase n=1 Tax=Ciona savignyi TaxID=51511 RepID=H2YDZ4_CIOSA
MDDFVSLNFDAPSDHVSEVSSTKNDVQLNLGDVTSHEIRNGEVTAPPVAPVRKNGSVKKVSWKDREEIVNDSTKRQQEKVEIPEISGLWWGETEHGLDDGKHEMPTSNLGRIQFRVRHVIDHLGMRVIGVILILLDIILMIIDLSLPGKSESSQMFYDGIALALSCYFMFDLLLRIFAYGQVLPKIYFTNPWEVVDGLIVVITFVVTIFYTVLDEIVQETGADGLGRLVALARLIRLVRLGRILYMHKQAKASSRKMISQNKRRYTKDGFDLDLTYVTDHVIAMSFPSSGRQSLFRNPIDEVSRFFKTKYPDKFRIYNLCSERGYDESKFDNRVYRVMIDDHNVPTLVDLLKFIDDAKAWLNSDADNVVAIHCKGGKGRTGTMVCSLLLEEGKFDTSKEALSYFGSRRTDFEVGDVFQGVETASQIRYVGYFEKIKKQYGSHLPPAKKMKISNVTITSILGVGRGNGSDLSMQILSGGVEVLLCKFAEGYNCEMTHNSEQDYVTCQVMNCPVLTGDIKVRFTSTSKTLPRGYDNCPFYFWFNTSLVEGDQMTLKREELDNPHKNKTWDIYRENFSVKLLFSDKEAI